MPQPARLARGIRMAGMSLLLGAFATGARAHDFWLSGERAAQEGPPELRMWVGHHLKAEENRPYDANRTQAFRSLDRHGTQDLAATARNGAEPFHTLPEKTEAALVALDRLPVDIVLDGAKFDGYLAEEHLQDIIALRRRQPPENGRERYTRHIKLLVGNPAGEQGPLHGRILGQPLEIVLLDAPGDPRPGRKLRAQVLFDGAPLAGRTLAVLHDPDARFDNDNAIVRTAVTDEDGMVRFDYDRPGFWMLRMVHMQPCKADCGDADWRSWWAAFAIQADWLPAATR